jgi:hypothetical protein
MIFLKTLIRPTVKHNQKINDDDSLKIEGVIKQTPRPKLNIFVNRDHKTQIIGVLG